ncbi:MAG: aminoglycoside 6-adenylyltransferase [Anaerolineales bacterium]|jgi:aminoglycoside 6-adenylyltransferase
MDSVTFAYEKLINRFIEWARVEDNIRVAIVIGSRARVDDHPADEWSDLDVLIFAYDPEPYWATAGWLRYIGNPWLTFLEPTPDGGGNERRVLFEGGLDVDFVPESIAVLEAMFDQGFPKDVADIFRRGVRVLVDKDRYSGRFQDIKIDPPGYSPPTEKEYLNLVNDFWYHTVWTGKHLRRGEIWWAKSGCDGYLKQLLRQMMEWHTRATKGEEVDTWMRGRFLEQWADPRVVKALPMIFAHYDEEDVWRALMATMELFHWLAFETADLLGYDYPAAGEQHATECVQELFSGSMLLKAVQ